MRTAILGLVSMGIVVSFAGCSPTVSRPDWFNPGPMIEQKQRAVQYDPYPDQDAGPEVVGGRPLDYERQIPETERSRFFLPSGNSGGLRNPANWFGRRTGSPTPLPTAPVIPPPGAQYGPTAPAGY